VAKRQKSSSSAPLSDPTPTNGGPEASSSPDRAALLALKAEIAGLRRTVDERLDVLAASVDRLLASVPAAPTPRPEPYQRPAPRATPRHASSQRYRVGDDVYVPRLGGTYVVVEVLPNSSTFKIQVGAMRAEIRYDEVWALDDRVSSTSTAADKGSEEQALPDDRPPTRPGFNPYIDEIDLHGYSERDAIVTLELFLHHAFMRKTPRVRIIHGKGAGVLRDAVRRELSKTPIVKSIESGPQYRGADGVTIANLDL